MKGFFAKYWAFALGLLLIVIDQATKWLVLKAWPGLLFANDSFAFSLPLQGLPLYFVLAVASALLIVFLVKRWTYFSQLERAAWVFVCAGGLGNIIDRVCLGYVRDFLHIGTGVLNIADFYIFAGAALLIVISFSPRRVE